MRNTKRQMDAHTNAIRTNVYRGPFSSIGMEMEAEPPTHGELSFWQQRAVDLQIKTMAPPTKPYWNTTMVTAWVAVIVGMITVMGFIGGLYAYTRSVSLEEGRRLGAAEERESQLRKQIDEATKKAEAADTKATYAVSGRDAETGHKK